MTGCLQVKGLPVVSSSDLACSGCGTCCTVYSKVDVNIADIFNISTYLDISPGEFFARYCKVINDREGSSIFLLDVEGGCKFRRDGKCAIYPVRPDMCALYPFNVLSMSSSAALKKNMESHKACFVHKLPDDTIIVPDVERMVDSRILFMIKEMYLAQCGAIFREEEALAYHQRGLAQVANARMREITHLQLQNEFINDPPLALATNEPLLTKEDVREVYKYARQLSKLKK